MADAAVETFFSKAGSAFPEPNAEGLVETAPFLQASSQLAEFFDLLGTVFTPVRADIGGNVKKLRHYCETHPDKCGSLNDIVEAEASNVGSVAVDALLWLKRALEFTLLILEGLAQDDAQDDLTSLCWQAYERTLKPFHGWFVQQIFSLVMKACPWRRDIVTALALGRTDVEEVVVREIRLMTANLRSDVTVINDLYDRYHLHSDAKV